MGGRGGEGWLRDKIEKMRTAQCDAEGVGGMNLRRSVMPMCHQQQLPQSADCLTPQNLTLANQLNIDNFHRTENETSHMESVCCGECWGRCLWMSPVVTTGN